MFEKEQHKTNLLQLSKMNMKTKVVAALCLMNIVNCQLTPYWDPLDSGVDGSLRGLSVVSDSVAWASGAGSTILRTIDGGITWTKVNSIHHRTNYKFQVINE